MYILCRYTRISLCNSILQVYLHMRTITCVYNYTSISVDMYMCMNVYICVLADVWWCGACPLMYERLYICILNQTEIHAT